jgi:DEAD/DEAH box helicase domain-containing protein
MKNIPIRKLSPWLVVAALAAFAIYRLKFSAVPVIAFVERDKLRHAVAGSIENLRNDIGGLRGLDENTLLRLLTGMLVQLKCKGGIEHPALSSYLKNWGNVYALRFVHFMTKFGTSSRAPAFLTKKRGTRFDALLGIGTSNTWFQQWLEKTLGLFNPAIAEFAEPIFDKLLPSLVDAGILIQHDIGGRAVWAIATESMRIGLAPQLYRCSKCGHSISGAIEEKESWIDMPCLRFNCGGCYTQEPPSEDYYGKLYSTGDVERLFAQEHTGLLDRKTRDDIEQRFKREATERVTFTCRYGWIGTMKLTNGRKIESSEFTPKPGACRLWRL